MQLDGAYIAKGGQLSVMSRLISIRQQNNGSLSPEARSGTEVAYPECGIPQARCEEACIIVAA